MKKRLIYLLLAIVMVISLAACNSKEDVKEEVTESQETPSENIGELKDNEERIINFAAMNGPTGVGSALMVDTLENIEESPMKINPKFYGAPDEIVAGIAKDEIDLAVIPANLAAVIYNNTEGKIQALATNNLGVLYILSRDKDVATLDDLVGKTVIAPGLGTTPEAVFKNILTNSDIDPDQDLNLEFKQEAAEVAQLMISGQVDIVMAPEPMATNILVNTEDVERVIDLNDEWEKIHADSKIVTGLLVARKGFIEENPDFIEELLNLFELSLLGAAKEHDKTAELVEKYSIMPKEQYLQSVDNMNFSFNSKVNMKNILSNYYKELFEADEKFVGGQLPDENFYYMGE